MDLGLEPDGAAGRGHFERIRQEIQQHLAQSIRFGLDAARAVMTEGEAHAAILGQHRRILREVMDERSGVERSGRKRDGPRIRA